MKRNGSERFIRGRGKESVLTNQIKFELKRNISRVNLLKTSILHPCREFSKIIWTQMNKTIIAIYRRSCYSVEKNIMNTSWLVLQLGSKFKDLNLEVLYKEVFLVQHRSSNSIWMILFHTADIPSIGRQTTKMPKVYNIHMGGIASRILIMWGCKMK